MKIIFSFIIMQFGCFLALAQKELVLSNGLKKEYIKEGKLLGVTMKVEEYKYSGWKNICTCSEAVTQNFWIVDSIGTGSMRLVNFNYTLSFRLDTVLGSKRTRKMRTYMFQQRIISESGNLKLDKFVYKVPTVTVSINERKLIKYDSIESFTFSHADIKKCKSKIEKIHFIDNVGVLPNFRLLTVLYVVSGILVEGVVNTTLTVAEVKNNIEEELHTYIVGDWEIKIK